MGAPQFSAGLLFFHALLILLSGIIKIMENMYESRVSRAKDQNDAD